MLAAFSLAAKGAVTTENHTVSFSESDYTFSYDENGNIVIGAVDGDVSYSSHDEPGLPQHSFSIAIPGTRKYASSSISYSKRLIRSNVRIAPGPIPVPTDGSVENIPTRVVTYENKSYPASNCFYSLSTQWSDLSIVHFITTPFVYDAAGQKLYFIDSIQLSVRTVERSANEIGVMTFADRDVVKSIVANKDAVSRMPAMRSASSGVSDGQEKIDYVVITNEELKPSFVPLVNWKLAKGLKSKIITTEEIDSKYQGASSQLRIKKCLYDLYQNNSLRYALLGGDDTVVPVRKCIGEVNPNTSGYRKDTIPTDLYYACFGLNFEWDANGNGIYGEEHDRIGMEPSIYVTRIPVRTSLDVNAFVYKLLKYEQNPKWNNNMLMCGVERSHDIDGRSDSEVDGEKLYNNYIRPSWPGKLYRFYDTYTDFPGAQKYDVTVSNLSEQMSNGYSFIDMITHGGANLWEMEDDNQYYTSENGSRQNNCASTIITTTACNTNAFDSSYDPCLSESLIRNPESGVIAYFGCSREGWSYRLSPALGPSLLYESHFYKRLFSDEFPESNFGVLTAAAKLALVNRSHAAYSPIRWLQFGLNPIGDPEMPIFTTNPQRFSKLIVQELDGELRIETGVDSCRICIMSAWDNGDSYYRVWNNVSKLNVTDYPSNFSICVTKQNYVPYHDVRGYIQNETLSGMTEMVGNIVKIGSDVTPLREEGPAIFHKGSTTKINAETTIMESVTKIRKGAKVSINNSKNQ